MQNTIFPSYPCIFLLVFVPFSKDKMSSQLKLKMACHTLQLEILYCNVFLKKVVLFGRSWLWCNFLSSSYGGGKRKKSSFVSLWNLLSSLYPVASIDPSACSTGLKLQVQVHPSSLKLVFPCLIPGWVRWIPCFHYLNTHCTFGIVLVPQQKYPFAAPLESPVREETWSVLLTTLTLAQSTGPANGIN